MPRGPLLAALAAIAAVTGQPAIAQTAAPAAPTPPATVASPRAERVAITVYRAPYGRGTLDLNYLGGFATVTETRRVRLPRGPAILRFEGVAAGIVPASAVIEGLPGGTVEKNRDARLLSPASLVDGTLGRRVTLTRTTRATGRRVSEEATIVAGSSGGRSGVVLRTASGIEGLRCSGLPETLGFAEVPAGLSAKPVLSVTTVSPSARTVTVRLSYLASDFDWRASYVATLAPDGRSLDLFAWLTLANGNPEGFPAAEVNAVAGRVNRTATPRLPVAAGALRLVCYPLGTTTSDLREEQFEPEEIVVTGARAMTMYGPPPPPPPPPPAPPAPPAPPEDLGDLKLYRVPALVSVSARGQKQVALLARSGVAFDRRYRLAIYPGVLPPTPTAIVLATRNTRQAGLGIALPSGSTALYAPRPDGTRLLLGLGTLTDRTEGETFRIAAGTSAQVLVEQTLGANTLTETKANEARLTVTNANPFPAAIELPIGSAGQTIEPIGETLPKIDGIATWSPTLPPGGRAELRYRF
jgi:hypothetical protein